MPAKMVAILSICHYDAGCRGNGSNPSAPTTGKEDVMIRLFFAPTPNGWKVSIMLEELGVDYRVEHVRLGHGEQYGEAFLAIAPNNRIPAIIDDAPRQGSEPVSLMESGAILLYLAEKHGQLMPADIAGRASVQQWLMWQMSGLGPMLGQHGHFLLYASEKIPYALDRYRTEARRLYGVLDRQLQRTGTFIAGDAYSIADIACFPWVMTHKKQQFDLDEFPAVRRWFAEVRARPAVQRGLAVGRELLDRQQPLGADMRAKLFGLGAPQAEPERTEPR
jgi:GSH-dependent disulfide-bond oxidoreductase